MLYVYSSCYMYIYHVICILAPCQSWLVTFSNSIIQLELKTRLLLRLESLTCCQFTLLNCLCGCSLLVV